MYGGAIVERDLVPCRSWGDMNDCTRSGKDSLETYRLLVAPGVASPGAK